MVTLQLEVKGTRLYIKHNNKTISMVTYTPETLHQLITLLLKSHIDYELCEEGGGEVEKICG